MARIRSSGGSLVGVSKKSFAEQTTITVFHGLGYFPFVWVVVDDKFIEVEIDYPTASTLRVSFSESLTGTIFWR